MIWMRLLSIIFFCVAIVILYQKYRIVIGGTKAMGKICDVKSQVISCYQCWNWKYKFSVEIGAYTFPIQSDLFYIKPHKKGDSCVVYYKNGRAVFAYHFLRELISILLLLYCIIFFIVTT